MNKLMMTMTAVAAVSATAMAAAMTRPPTVASIRSMTAYGDDMRLTVQIPTNGAWRVQASNSLTNWTDVVDTRTFCGAPVYRFFRLVATNDVNAASGEVGLKEACAALKRENDELKSRIVGLENFINSRYFD